MIVSSGPSAKDVPLELAQGKAKFIAVNESWRLAPWTDVLFGVDKGWWDEAQGVPGYHGLKVGCLFRYGPVGWGVKSIDFLGPKYEMRLDGSHSIAIGNSGFGAVNLAAQFGAKRILLVGYDYSLANGVHWHGPHPLRNPKDESVLRRWGGKLDAQAHALKRHGVEVINCSADSTLKNFRKLDFEEAINESWSPRQAGQD